MGGPSTEWLIYGPHRYESVFSKIPLNLAHLRDVHFGEPCQTMSSDYIHHFFFVFNFQRNASPVSRMLSLCPTTNTQTLCVVRQWQQQHHLRIKASAPHCFVSFLLGTLGIRTPPLQAGRTHAYPVVEIYWHTRPLTNKRTSTHGGCFWFNYSKYNPPPPPQAIRCGWGKCARTDDSVQCFRRIVGEIGGQNIIKNYFNIFQ